MTRAIEKIERRYGAWFGCLPEGTPTQASMLQAHAAIAHAAVDAQSSPAPASGLSAQMRILRQIVFRRLYQLDCEQSAALSVVMQGMTDLAEVCIGLALQHTHQQLAQQHGEPCDAKGNPSCLWPVGMGKLGARELNISSDIDLIFIYSADGETRTLEPRQTCISNQNFFTQQVRLVQALLAEVTQHGFVFRVDLDLRPYGRDGPYAMSLATLANYFQNNGREWERFAWLKSRVLSGADSSALALRAVVRAFVFRRFLDYKVFVSLEALHAMIRKNVPAKLAHLDVKLGIGGIREIEFAAQVQQIVRGGRQPELLARPTLTALQRLAHAGLMASDGVVKLSEAYDFLRRTEHRIQYLDDLQTHILPSLNKDKAWLASSMGFAIEADFEAQLAKHRRNVATIFEQWLDAGIAPKKPTVTVAQLQAKAAWTVSYLRKHPDVIDELQRADVLSTRFDAALFQSKVRAQYKALQATGLCDEEAVLDLLRRAHHIELFRILVRDVEGLLSVRDVADELSALADSLLALALPWCWEALPARLREGSTLTGSTLQERFCVIAYGKLGGKELGYGSDLDVVFLYEDAHDKATELYVALVRKLITWLTVKTGEGDLYEIDTALRPNGNSGHLVTSVAAYQKYQLQLGSNAAWTWELQAMTRARCVFGSQALSRTFNDIRASVLTKPRDAAQIQADIAAMRQKLYTAYPAPAGQFDIKHSIGGMMDAEFAVQSLVLLQARHYPALLGNVGNIELLKMAEAAQLLPSGVGIRAADAYQVLRDQQHAARLQEVKAVLSEAELRPERAAITALWEAVMSAKDRQ